mmetsp:Transcript_8973/g.30625  ORF Transcript_8973/g.30625 Transcript_8973/m.30625 type:complete len:228 (-) Transcript_8973:625-1308(-)
MLFMLRSSSARLTSVPMASGSGPTRAHCASCSTVIKSATTSTSRVRTKPVLGERLMAQPSERILMSSTGMAPESSLPRTSRRCSDVSDSNTWGSSPVSLLLRQLNWFSSWRLPISSGMGPTNSLLSRSSICRCAQLPREGGMGPEKALLFTYSSRRCPRALRSASGPVKRLRLRYRICRLARRVISGGRRPVSSLSRHDSSSRDLRLPMARGNGPVSRRPSSLSSQR